jgi:hypothetical protein
MSRYARDNRYAASEKGKARTARYEATDKAKARKKRYDDERVARGHVSPPSRRNREQYDREYRLRPEVRLAERLGIAVGAARDLLRERTLT